MSRPICRCDTIGSACPDPECQRRYQQAQGGPTIHYLISARFTGADGSVGFKRGQSYTLRIWTGRKPVVICRHDSPEDSAVPYGSIEAFLNDWTDINVIGRR